MRASSLQGARRSGCSVHLVGSQAPTPGGPVACFLNRIPLSLIQAWREIMGKRMDPGSPMMGDDTYHIKARNISVTSHARKRIIISYVYLLVLRELRTQSLIAADAQLKVTPATLQAKRSSAPNQAAHQLLRELMVDNGALYRLDGISPEIKKTLVYCSSATSDINAEFNRADN